MWGGGVELRTAVEMVQNDVEVAGPYTTSLPPPPPPHHTTSHHITPHHTTPSPSCRTVALELVDPDVPAKDQPERGLGFELGDQGVRAVVHERVVKRDPEIDCEVLAGAAGLGLKRRETDTALDRKDQSVTAPWQ